MGVIGPITTLVKWSGSGWGELGGLGYESSVGGKGGGLLCYKVGVTGPAFIDHVR